MKITEEASQKMVERFGKDTVIFLGTLCVKLTEGLLFYHGTRYDIEF